MLQILTAYQVGGTQRLTAFQIGLGLLKRGLLQRNGRLILLTVDDQLVGLAHGGGQRGLRFFKRLLGIGAIQRDQHVAFFDVVSVIKPDFINASRYLRHHLSLVSGYVSVIGFLIVTQHQEPVGQVSDADNDAHYSQQKQRALTRLFLPLRLLRCLRGRIITHGVLPISCHHCGQRAPESKMPAAVRWHGLLF